ncbi:Transcription factor 25 [Homalodisca vitripennis]|nr:Transcription factor 25 [Homalodisca vitripennis]
MEVSSRFRPSTTNTTSGAHGGIVQSRTEVDVILTDFDKNKREAIVSLPRKMLVNIAVSDPALYARNARIAVSDFCSFVAFWLDSDFYGGCKVSVSVEFRIDRYADEPSRDEVERSVREVNELLGDTPGRVTQEPASMHAGGPKKGILNIEHRSLNPNNELKRIFGSKIVQNEQRLVVEL